MSNKFQDLAAKGYEVFPGAKGKKGIYIENWARLDYKEYKAHPAFARMNPTQIGVRCNNGIIAVDIDCVECTDEIIALMHKHLGENPYMRIGRPGRAMFIYRMGSNSPRKITTGKFGVQEVEILGEGSQFIIAGIHPEGHEYTCPELPPIEELPLTNPESLSVFMGESIKVLETRGERVSASGGGGYVEGEYLPPLTTEVITQKGGVATLAELELGERVCMDFLREDATNTSSGVVYDISPLRIVDHGTKLVHREKPDVSALVEMIKDESPFPIACGRGDLPLPRKNEKNQLMRLQDGHLENVAVVLSKAGIEIKHNELTCENEYWWHGKSHTLDDFVTWCKIAKVTTGIAAAEMEAVAHSFVTPYNPVKDWIPEWDGVSRWDEFCDTLTATQSDELKKAIMRAWMLQAIDAQYGPPAQRGQVLVLAGPQGIGKTRWIEALAPGFTQTDVHLDMSFASSTKDSIAKATCTWIAELGELDATFRKSDISKLKGFLTATHDTYRSPYERSTRTHVRRTVFAGSVNDDQFLVDTTGSRRFMPLGCIHIELYTGDMGQVWAEALTWWSRGERWHSIVKGIEAQLAENAEGHRDIGAVEDVIRSYYEHHSDAKKVPSTLMEVMARVGLEHATDRRSRAEARQIIEKLCGKQKRLPMGDGTRKDRSWLFPSPVASFGATD